MMYTLSNCFYPINSTSKTHFVSCIVAHILMPQSWPSTQGPQVQRQGLEFLVVIQDPQQVRMVESGINVETFNPSKGGRILSPLRCLKYTLCITFSELSILRCLETTNSSKCLGTTFNTVYCCKMSMLEQKQRLPTYSL